MLCPSEHLRSWWSTAIEKEMKDQICPFTSGNVKLMSDNSPSGRDHRWLLLTPSFFKHFPSLSGVLSPTSWCLISFAYIDFLFPGKGSNYREGSCFFFLNQSLGIGNWIHFTWKGPSWHSCSQVYRTSALPPSPSHPPQGSHWPDAWVFGVFKPLDGDNDSSHYTVHPLKVYKSWTYAVQASP